MSGRTTNDGGGGSPPDGAGYPEGDERTAAAERAAPRPKAKRPRPTFDDGAITRVFKFPSKTYPRSSYYVTGGEIIIRIRKARKRWKLVIPKKRLVSYRTNRWFAKPRWVEIELTYTQATKLGLVERRVVAKEAAGDTQAGPQEVEQASIETDSAAADETVLELDSSSDEPAFPADAEAPPAEAQVAEDSPASASAGTGDPAPDIEPEVSRADEAIVQPDVECERECESASQPDADLASAVEAVEAAAPAAGVATAAPDVPAADVAAAESTLDQPSAAREEASPEPPQPVLASVPPPIFETVPPPRYLAPIVPERPVAPPPLAVMARGRGGDRPVRRGAVAVPMTLAVLLAGSAVGWMLLGEAPDMRNDLQIACARPEPAAHCTQTITTGSIAPVEVPPVPEPSPQAEPTPVVVPALVPTIVIEPPVPEGIEAPAPEIATSLPPRETVVAAAVEEPPATNVEPEPEPVPQSVPRAAPALAAEAPPAAANVEPVIELPQRAAVGTRDCDDVVAAARSIEIRFDYASASIAHATNAALVDFAGKLRSCAAAAVIIEGHTDSDGDADRNLALSARRAQAVWRALVSAGARPDRLSVVGFGHARPAAPNLSPESKRSNRRAVLVVELPGGGR